MGRISGFGFTGTFMHVNPGSILQSDEQPSPFTVLPSSHCLPSPVRIKPLPHTLVQAPPAAAHLGSRRQNGEQPSPVTSLPSSHCSEPSTLPFPHTVVVHVVGPLHIAGDPPSLPPSAPTAPPVTGEVQTHPSGTLAGLLSSVQLALQPSPSVVL